MAFIEQFDRLINENNLSVNKVFSQLKIGKNSYAYWKEKGNLPSGETLLKLADFFGVTTDELLDRKNDETMAMPPQYLSVESEEQKAGLDFHRLDNLRKAKGISNTFLCNLVGQRRQYIADSKAKNINIPDDYINLWADALGTSPEYLKGETDNPDTIKEAPSPAQMDKRKARLIEIYDSMPDDESKDKLLQVVVSFERVNKYEIESQYIGGIAAKGGNKPIIKQIPHKDK